MSNTVLIGGPLDGVSVKSPAGDNPAEGYELWFPLDPSGPNLRTACYRADGDGRLRYTFTRYTYNPSSYDKETDT